MASVQCSVWKKGLMFQNCLYFAKETERTELKWHFLHSILEDFPFFLPLFCWAQGNIMHKAVHFDINMISSWIELSLALKVAQIKIALFLGHFALKSIQYLNSKLGHLHTPRTTKILVVPAYSHWGLNPPMIVCKGEEYDEQAMNNIFTEYYSAYSLCKWAELRELWGHAYNYWNHLVKGFLLKILGLKEINCYGN